MSVDPIRDRDRYQKYSKNLHDVILGTDLGP